MPGLYLVRHGRPVVDPSTAAHSWGLDPDGGADIDVLARSGRLPEQATWFTSPEPKAAGTAQRLRGRPVAVVGALAEHRREPRWFGEPEQFRAAVRRAFDDPVASAVPGWEPLVHTRDRLLPAVRRILADHPDDVVLVGHGTAWTLLASELTGKPPDLAAWEALAMPDLWVLDRADLHA